jgi:hypothetical protein
MSPPWWTFVELREPIEIVLPWRQFHLRKSDFQETICHIAMISIQDASGQRHSFRLQFFHKRSEYSVPTLRFIYADVTQKDCLILVEKSLKPIRLCQHNTPDCAVRIDRNPRVSGSTAFCDDACIASLSAGVSSDSGISGATSCKTVSMPIASSLLATRYLNPLAASVIAASPTIVHVRFGSESGEIEELGLA